MSRENDILKEQRLARKSFLELKKMESEANTEKPSEEVKKKKTFSDFWYYYKIPVFITLFLAAIIAVGINQCVNREKYDMVAVLYSYHSVNSETEAKITEYLENKTEDFNSDGSVKASVINCTFEVGVSSAQYGNTMGQKFNSLIAGNTKAMLFVLNREVYDYVNGETEIFEEPVELGDDFYSVFNEENRESAEKGLLICRRKIEGTFMENDEEAKIFFENAGKIIENIKNAR